MQYKNHFGAFKNESCFHNRRFLFIRDFVVFFCWCCFGHMLQLHLNMKSNRTRNLWAASRFSCTACINVRKSHQNQNRTVISCKQKLNESLASIEGGDFCSASRRRNVFYQPPYDVRVCGSLRLHGQNHGNFFLLSGMRKILAHLRFSCLSLSSPVFFSVRHIMGFVRVIRSCLSNRRNEKIIRNT